MWWCNFRVYRYTTYSFAGEMRNVGASLCDKKEKERERIHTFPLCLLGRIPDSLLSSFSALFSIREMTRKIERHKTNFLLFTWKVTDGSGAQRGLGGGVKIRFPPRLRRLRIFWDFSKR